MKLLFFLFIITIVGFTTYFISYRILKSKGKKKNRKPIWITSAVVLGLLLLLAFGIYSSSIQADIQCGLPHSTTLVRPLVLKTAQDHLALGDYDYELGNCSEAVIDYSKAISINPSYSQVYNNRGYTYMRLRDYQKALVDLNKAISINPNYVQALMNRGDIHNYYYQIDREAAIADYEKVLSIVGPSAGNTSVCGHLFLAKHGGWTVSAYFDFFKDLITGGFFTCK